VLKGCSPSAHRLGGNQSSEAFPFPIMAEPSLLDGEFVSALSGAFFGATVGFILGVFVDARKRLDQQYAEFLRVQLIFIERINTMKNYQLQTRPLIHGHWLQLKTGLLIDSVEPLLPLPREIPEPSPQNIGWIIARRDADPSILMRMMLANSDYQNFIGVLEERNRAIEKRDENSTERVLDPVQNKVGSLYKSEDVWSVIHLSKDMIRFLDRAANSNSEIFHAIRREGRLLFGGNIFYRYRRALFMKRNVLSWMQ
jgi:hypothetical protein